MFLAPFIGASYGYGYGLVLLHIFQESQRNASLLESELTAAHPGKNGAK